MLLVTTWHRRGRSLLTFSVARCMDFSSAYRSVYGFLQKYRFLKEKYGFWEEKYKFSKFFKNLTWFLPKVPIISKNASNKSCPKLNFLQVTHWMYISISSRNGARLLQIFAIFKWCNRTEKQVHFGAERFQSTDYI